MTRSTTPAPRRPTNSMSMSEEWREIAVHRSAGLAGQLNIETVLPPGSPRPFWLDELSKNLGGAK